MEVGTTTTLPPEAAAQRARTPVIDERPAATVEPAEPEARNNATTRDEHQVNARDERRADADAENDRVQDRRVQARDSEDIRANRRVVESPARVPEEAVDVQTAPAPESGLERRLTALSDEAVRALTVESRNAEVDTQLRANASERDRAVQAYEESLDRASAGRPAFDDFLNGSGRTVDTAFSELTV